MLTLISRLKAAAIRAADTVNALHDPFQEFTRTAVPKYPQTLSEKAQKFEDDFLLRFMLDHPLSNQGVIGNYRIPLPIGSPLDLGDQALWHGIYMAMFAFKYAALNRSRDPKIMIGSPEEQNASLQVMKMISGCKSHQYAHGEGKARLIRGVDETGRWQDDASNDTATGHMAGLYYAWEYGPSLVKPAAALYMENLAVELIDHEYALVKADGTPTTFGALDQGWKTDPLRLTLLLAILRATHKMTGDSAFKTHYDELLKAYAPIVPYPKVKLLWMDNKNDTHRAAIHLSILARLEDDPNQRVPFLQGLERLWSIERKSGNAWVGFLCAMHGVVPACDIDICKKVLSEFTTEDKQFNSERINSTGEHATAAEVFCIAPGQLSGVGVKKTLWNNEWVTAQPLPRWMCSAQDFFWQRSLYTIDKAGGPDSIYNGGDFLAAYWLGRLLEKIKDTE